MSNDSPVDFRIAEIGAGEPASHELIQATVLSSSLTDSRTIDWVIDSIEGCSLLYPRADLVLDLDRVHEISSSFFEELGRVREQVESRGGLLRIQAGGNGTEQTHELPQFMNNNYEEPLLAGR